MAMGDQGRPGSSKHVARGYQEPSSGVSQGGETAGGRRGKSAFTVCLLQVQCGCKQRTNHLSPAADEISLEIVNKHKFLEPFDIATVSKCMIIFSSNSFLLYFTKALVSD